MNPEPTGSIARRYLLGETTEEERDALERLYFDDDAALNRIAVEEEALIEDYLDGKLDARDRRSFEETYLASPVHRRRVDTIRRLSAADATRRGAAPALAEAGASYKWLAIAATLVLAVGTLSLFMARRPHGRGAARVSPPTATVEGAKPSPAPPAAAPRLFAFSLSPVATRGADDSALPLVIPDRTDSVLLQLGVRGGAAPPNARVEIRTVGGNDVWRGAAAASVDASSQPIVTAQVPAAVLPADDYIVLLYARGPGRGEQEADRYFLRVR